MSGLNPFRRRLSDDPAGKRSSSPASGNRSTESPSTAPATSSAPAPASVQNPPKPNGLIQEPHDDSASSDGQSVTDPFNPDSYSSDHEEDLQAAAPQKSPPTSTPPSVVIRAKRDREHPTRESEEEAPSNTAAKSDVLVHSLPSPRLGSHTASSSSTDVSESSRMGDRPTERAMETDKEPKILASRAGNREKKPPPPPRSHHGKLISPNPTTQPSTSTPSSLNRFSFYGSSTEAALSRPGNPSLSTKQSSNGNGLAENQPPRAETLQRSQSQYKRPPTPPLSRRQSQMRRSKTTYSKTHPNRVASGDIESGDHASITSRRESRSSTPVSDEPPSRTQSYEEPVNTTAASENAPQPRLSASKSAKRMSYTHMGPAVPPPPPPRRVRSGHQDKTAKQEEDFVPHPSNASDILADLSKLQKEVDDLRGHYEGRKVSH